MSLTVDVIVDEGVSVDEGADLRQALQFTFEREPSAPAGDWEMTVRLTDDRAIVDAHSRYFSDPSPTDVISFPSGDELSDGAGYLGDVMISVETAQVQAQHVGHSTAREITFLALHGLLHLCGWEDDSDPAREAMLRRQSQLLEEYEQAAGRPS